MKCTNWRLMTTAIGMMITDFQNRSGSGKARHGKARQGPAGQGMAWQGLEIQRSASTGAARWVATRGRAGRGEAGPGMAGQGKGCNSAGRVSPLRCVAPEAGLGRAGPGIASAGVPSVKPTGLAMGHHQRQGTAWLGGAWRGSARHGKGWSSQRQAHGLGDGSPSEARHGWARPGRARHGMARAGVPSVKPTGLAMGHHQRRGQAWPGLAWYGGARQWRRKAHRYNTLRG